MSDDSENIDTEGWTNEQWETAYKEQAEKAESNRSGWMRAQADYQNYKKRIEQDRSDMNRYAISPILLHCLSVIDDLERAFTALPVELSQLTWVSGIALIHRKMYGILDSNGVLEIEADGKKFDPNLHEAISQAPGEEGKIISVIQRGYQVQDRVLRPALVQVGNGESVEEQDNKKEETEETK
jgi:molecular chaperone GrpE